MPAAVDPKGNVLAVDDLVPLAQQEVTALYAPGIGRPDLLMWTFLAAVAHGTQTDIFADQNRLQ